ncbi:hypothetical protein [Listeria booriae]|uniref:hypothetical protein n=1 Tax=Listeria booriae TaxID=1552123 RepID=UPI0016278A34|nr:hypothetical protein [Listeria booriae]MBC1233676.1 DUF4145 domain-containing protein [Listeria booriae]
MEFPLYYYDEDEHLPEKQALDEILEIDPICCHCKNTGVQVPLVMVENISDNDEYDGYAFTACHLCKCTSMHYLIQFTTETPSIHGIDYGRQFKVTKSFPSRAFDREFSDEVSKISKDFIDIYNQSKEAENTGLDKIAGMGYRKATEFLVTDYLKWIKLEDVDNQWLENPKTPLAAKIAKIPNEKTRDVSKAISYLGNDETHYTRRHPEYDVQFIKAFISVLVTEIESEITYREAKNLLSKK